MTRTARTSPSSPLRIFACLLVATFAHSLSFTCLFSVLPTFVAGELGGGSLWVASSVGAFNLGGLLFRPLAGRLTDRAGRRVPVVVGSWISIVSLLGLFVTTALPLVVLLRFVHGTGNALFHTAATSGAVDAAPPGRRGQYLSIFSLAFLFALAVGPTAGESVRIAYGTSAVWVLGLAGGALAAALVLTLPKEHRHAASRATPAPLVYRAALAPGAMHALSLASYAAFTAFLPLYVVSLGLALSGPLFALYALTVVTSRLLGGRGIDRLGPRRASILSVLLIAAGMVAIGTVKAPAILCLGTVVFALGQALSYPSMLSLALVDAPEAERGAAVGTFSAFINIGMSVGALVTGLVAWWGGYASAFVVGGLTALVGLLLVPGPGPFKKSGNPSIAASDRAVHTRDHADGGTTPRP